MISFLIVSVRCLSEFTLNYLAEFRGYYQWLNDTQRQGF
jgi:hypothetical protein